MAQQYRGGVTRKSLERKLGAFEVSRCWEAEIPTYLSKSGTYQFSFLAPFLGPNSYHVARDIRRQSTHMYVGVYDVCPRMSVLEHVCIGTF